MKYSYMNHNHAGHINLVNILGKRIKGRGNKNIQRSSRYLLMGVLVANGAEVVIARLTHHIVQVLSQVVHILLLVSWKGMTTCYFRWIQLFFPHHKKCGKSKNQLV